MSETMVLCVQSSVPVIKLIAYTQSVSSHNFWLRGDGTMRTYGPVGDGKLSWPIINVSRAPWTLGDCWAMGICRGGEPSIARANGAPHISGDANPQSGDFIAVKKAAAPMSLSRSLALSLSLFRARALSLSIHTNIYTQAHLFLCEHTCCKKAVEANSPAKKRGYFSGDLMSLVSPTSCLLFSEDSGLCCLIFRRDAGVSFVACF
jgi:hypothetical protein